VYIGVSSWGLILGHKLPNTTGIAVQAPLTQAYNNMFRAHRIEPFGQFCANPPVKSDGTIDLDQWNGVCSFRSMVINGAIAPPMIMNGPFANVTWNPPYSAWEKTLAIEPGLAGAWEYLTDEPNADWSGANNYDPNLAGTAARIAASEAGCPTCRSMVTHYPDSRLVGLDIAVPSFEQVATYPLRANDWVYGACNSHGSCANGTVGTGSGAPDMMLDQPSYHALMYPVVCAALGGKACLYYSAVVDYGSIDPWVNQYKFGGNGDGQLVLPCGPTVGHGCSTDQPIATIRMKLLRDGQILAEKLKFVGKLSTVVRSATDWEKNYDILNLLY